MHQLLQLARKYVFLELLAVHRPGRSHLHRIVPLLGTCKKKWLSERVFPPPSASSAREQCTMTIGPVAMDPPQAGTLAEQAYAASSGWRPLDGDRGGDEPCIQWVGIV